QQQCEKAKCNRVEDGKQEGDPMYSHCPGREDLEDCGAEQHPERMIAVGGQNVVECAACTSSEIPRNLEVEIAVIGEKLIRTGDDHGGEGNDDSSECKREPGISVITPGALQSCVHRLSFCIGARR